jgi:hypothetical protein
MVTMNVTWKKLGSLNLFVYQSQVCNVELLELYKHLLSLYHMLNSNRIRHCGVLHFIQMHLISNSVCVIPGFSSFLAIHFIITVFFNSLLNWTTYIYTLQVIIPLAKIIQVSCYLQAVCMRHDYACSNT